MQGLNIWRNKMSFAHPTSAFCRLTPPSARGHSEKNIHVPKGITPNNDGHNDKLYPIPVGIKTLKAFRIYNRWGLLMYDNKDAGINDGWDGKYLGKPQPTETYTWIAEGIDDDGNLIRRSGNTILIR